MDNLSMLKPGDYEVWWHRLDEFPEVWRRTKTRWEREGRTTVISRGEDGETPHRIGRRLPDEG